MSTNKIEEGKSLTYSNSGAEIKSGDVVVIGNQIGVAVADIPATTGEGAVEMEGVFELPMNVGETFAQGDKLFWDVSEGELTKTSAGNIPAGCAWEAAGSSDTKAKVKLGGGADFSPSDMGELTQAAVVAALGSTAALTALVPAAASISASDGAFSTPPVKSEIDAAIDALKDKVITALAAKADNADAETLRTEVEARLDAVEGKVDAILAAMKTANLMASA